MVPIPPVGQSSRTPHGGAQHVARTAAAASWAHGLSEDVKWRVRPSMVQATKDRDDDFGSGSVDPSKAIQTAGDLSSTMITGSTPRPGADPKRSP